MERIMLVDKTPRVVVMSGDFAARRILIQAFLYYVMEDATMTDDEYDKLSIYVARHWDELSDDRKWACGSPEAIRSSGHHCKFSMHVVSAALNHLKYKTGASYHDYADDVWKLRRNGTRFVTCSAPKPRKVKAYGS